MQVDDARKRVVAAGRRCRCGTPTGGLTGRARARYATCDLRLATLSLFDRAQKEGPPLAGEETQFHSRSSSSRVIMHANASRDVARESGRTREESGRFMTDAGACLHLSFDTDYISYIHTG